MSCRSHLVQSIERVGIVSQELTTRLFVTGSQEYSGENENIAADAVKVD